MLIGFDTYTQSVEQNRHTKLPILAKLILYLHI